MASKDQREGYARVTKARLRNLEKDRERLKFLMSVPCWVVTRALTGYHDRIEIKSRKDVDRVMEAENGE